MLVVDGAFISGIPKEFCMLICYNRWLVGSFQVLNSSFFHFQDGCPLAPFLSSLEDFLHSFVRINFLSLCLLKRLDLF